MTKPDHSRLHAIMRRLTHEEMLLVAEYTQENYDRGYRHGLIAAYDQVHLTLLTEHHLGDADAHGDAARRLWPKLVAAKDASHL